MLSLGGEEKPILQGGVDCRAAWGRTTVDSRRICFIATHFFPFVLPPHKASENRKAIAAIDSQFDEPPQLFLTIG